ncbi:MAG: hypothetical protein ACRDV8_06365, partial [Acidimicrobiales bacterium]
MSSLGMHRVRGHDDQFLFPGFLSAPFFFFFFFVNIQTPGVLRVTTELRRPAYSGDLLTEGRLWL